MSARVYHTAHHKKRKRKVGLYYVARSCNQKTGDIPQQFVGATRDESRATCQGCPLLDTICYAQNGTEAYFGHRQIIKTAATGKDYSIEQALKKRNKRSKYVRFGAIGDPSAIEPETYTKHERMVRESGMGLLSYTHFWKSRGQHLKGRAMASCDTWEEAEEATDQGWRAAVHVPALDKPQGKTASGKRYTLCPAQRTRNRIQCNDCGLCDATKQAAEIIVFLNH